MGEPTLELKGLRKSYGGRVVLDGIELAVERGTILGYIGPNGAGKSTTVKILCGLLPEFEGEVRVLGLDPRADPVAVKRRIGYVPENALAGILSNGAWWSVPMAVLLGIPLYSNAAGMIPIVGVLVEKGASLGTALAFMMAVIGLSLPEAVILRRVLKMPLLVTFFGVIGASIILIGYLFNWII